MLEKTLESPLDCARRSNQSILKEISPNIHWKDWCWSWSCNTLAMWYEEPTHLKRPWFWERLKVGGEGDSRGWDGWMASQTQWTWVWVNSGSWWMTGSPEVLRHRGSQTVRHNWATELQWKTQIVAFGIPGHKDRIIVLGRLLMCSKRNTFHTYKIPMLLLSRFSHVRLCATP